MKNESYLKTINVDELSLNKYNIYGYFNDIFKSILNGNLIIDGPLANLKNNQKIKLKLHQKRMVYEMLKREDINYRLTSRINAFVLCDKVGSGKSIDILSLISIKPFVNKYTSNILKFKPSEFLYCDFYGVNFKPTVNYKTNLIVVPHGIILQWENYLLNFEDLSYYSIKSVRDLRNLKINDIKMVNIMLFYLNLQNTMIFVIN